MALTSAVLAGNSRLESAAAGGPSIKKAPPDDDADAVRRLQQAFKALGFLMPLSFSSGTGNAPDGRFGEETYRTVLAFQKREFPGDQTQWDGRVGQHTLGRMDQMLSMTPPEEPVLVLPMLETIATQCTMTTPLPGSRRG